MNNIKIIEYEEKYLDDIRNLLVELEEYIVSIDKDNLDQVGKDYREKMALCDLKLVKENNGKTYLAILNNKVIGLIMGIEIKYSKEDYFDYKCPKKGSIIELIVTKNFRTSGVGKVLMKKMEDYFLSIGCEYISIDVFGYNENAINFYSKEGYHTRMLDMIKKINE